MSDNVPTANGYVIATDEVGGFHYQRIKSDFGVEGAAALGGLIYRNLDLGTTGQVVKASAGRLLTLVVANQHASLRRYLKIYNKASAPTNGDTPVQTIPLSFGVTLAVDLGAAGALFAAGISLRASTAIADNDNTAPSANDVVVNATYV